MGLTLWFYVEFCMNSSQVELHVMYQGCQHISKYLYIIKYIVTSSCPLGPKEWPYGAEPAPLHAKSPAWHSPARQRSWTLVLLPCLVFLLRGKTWQGPPSIYRTLKFRVDMCAKRTRDQPTRVLLLFAGVLPERADAAVVHRLCQAL